VNKQALQANLPESILFVLITYIIYRACLEFYNITWGTGFWWGEFSLKWGIAFILFLIFCIFCLFALWFALWRNPETTSYINSLTEFRTQMGFVRYLAMIIVLVLPIWLLQYSYWGVVFSKPYMRLLIWLITIIFLAFFITSNKDRILTWSGFIAAVFFAAVAFSLAVPLISVTNYPFSLGWSEGNRMWDYSLLFGSNHYNYLHEKPPVAYLDLGRQLGGGLPFVFPDLTIFQERLWLALMMIVPYILLGGMAFSLNARNSKWLAFLGGLWAWMFLGMGPIHAPLLWSAILVALAWRRPLWFAVPLIIISAYITTISRSTWVFAPAMWIGVLELGSASLDQFHIQSKTWWRAITLVFAGLVGGPFSSTLLGLGNWLIAFFGDGAATSGMPAISPGSVTISSVATQVTNQPLLWYRLLPNATYGNGILLGLLIATAPLIVVLVHLYVVRVWVLNFWQKLVILFSLFAFLIVGLIVSTKIGGGGDLHNMDMFLIGLMFSAALAWRAGGYKWIGEIEDSPQSIRFVFLLLIALPAFGPLITMRPLSFDGDTQWLATLADAKTPKALGLLPSNVKTESMLETLRQYVQNAQTRGEILFMDQRQLLTFGYVQDVTLVSEYEKKLMMDKALSSDATYFKPFYRDLAAHRFSLIISDPLRTPIKDSDYQFGEENNAWVKWISDPVLCYYEPTLTIPEFRLQLLVPKENPSDCSQFQQ